MTIENEKILAECQKNLERGRAVATGIGVFALIEKEGRYLLRKRQEKGSLYNQDLSGKYELIGGGVEVSDFGSGYTTAILKCLGRELHEEGGLVFIALTLNCAMLPAWLAKGNQIDLAFVIGVSWDHVDETPEFREKLASGELKFFDKKEIQELEIISPRMKYLITEGIDYFCL